MFQGQFPVSVFLFFKKIFINLFLHSISSGLRVKLTSYMSNQLSSLQKNSVSASKRESIKSEALAESMLF